jgi:hypothetical protein
MQAGQIPTRGIIGMPRTRVFVVHDETGRIISVARPASDAKVIIFGGEGKSVLETEVDAGRIADPAGGRQRVDVAHGSLLARDD